MDSRDQAMLPLTGYLDRLSARPGGRIDVKVSSTLGEPYTAQVVRIVHGDPNPAGPGMRILEVPNGDLGSHPARCQQIQFGSYVEIPASRALSRSTAFTWVALVQPTLLRERPQAVLSLNDTIGRGCVLAVTASGTFCEIADGKGGTLRAAVASPLVERAWYRLWASYDPGSGRLRVGQEPLEPRLGLPGPALAEATGPAPVMVDLEVPFLIGACGGEAPDWHFNGKIEDPAVYDVFHDGDDGEGLDPAAGTARLVAWWDFSRGIDTQRVSDLGSHGLDGRLVNLPTRAVRGSRWSGREMCWRHAPRDYAAIHFHEDDLYDCGWETDFVFTVPEMMASGAYGIRLSCGGDEDILPFYVLPAKGARRRPVAFLASTFTYQAYANHARGNCDDAYRARAAAWGAYPWNPDDYPIYGRSTYNRHPDGSGFCYSSRLRPMLTMRPGFLTFVDARGSGLRHFPADTHLLDWLEAKGFDFDVVTDEDLDDEGVDLIRDYKVVLTGSHPEYHTAGTLGALQSYTGGGGRLIYLGGNGFYWRIARSPELPGVIEVRRAEGGIRAWAAEPGEYYHSLDGQYGGLWRRSNRYPQELAGVGFSAQGLFEGSYYRRMPGADDPRATWIFEGIEDAVIGDFGLSGGGAAGFELDRADVQLGTPQHALILARSEGHSSSFIVVPEELLSHIATLSGEKPADLVRGEIVYFETAGGGAVFSVGSITFCGSLSHAGYDNNVSRMLENVVRRFAG